MKINEVCKVKKLPDGTEYCPGPKIKQLSPEQKAIEKKQEHARDVADERFYRKQDHNLKSGMGEGVKEASFDLPSSNFRHTEKFTVGTGKELEFAKYIARQLETMGVTKEQAIRLYKASKDGDYSWVERFGKSPKLKQLIGHNIGTAMTTNAVAIHNGMGLLAGLLKIQPKQTKIPTPSRVPDDLQPGGHDTDEYLQAKDAKQARQYYDRDMNWSGLR